MFQINCYTLFYDSVRIWIIFIVQTFVKKSTILDFLYDDLCPVEINISGIDSKDYLQKVIL